MKINKLKKAALWGTVAGVGLGLAGCAGGPGNGYNFHFTLHSGPWNNAAQGAPAPSGYSSWDDYASANGDSDGSVVDPSTVPAPSGYASWDDFNNDPSVTAPSGYNTWSDWLNANGSSL